MPNDPAAPRIHDLPEPERKPFAEWLRGSAAPWIEGVPLGEQDAYYLHDYRRWKRAWGPLPLSLWATIYRRRWTKTAGNVECHVKNGLSLIRSVRSSGLSRGSLPDFAARRAAVSKPLSPEFARKFDQALAGEGESKPRKKAHRVRVGR